MGTVVQAGHIVADLVVLHFAAQFGVGQLLFFNLLQGRLQLLLALAGLGQVLPAAEHAGSLSIGVAQGLTPDHVLTALTLALEAVFGGKAAAQRHGLLVGRAQGHGLHGIEQLGIAGAQGITRPRPQPAGSGAGVLIASRAQVLDEHAGAQLLETADQGVLHPAQAWRHRRKRVGHFIHWCRCCQR